MREEESEGGREVVRWRKEKVKEETGDIRTKREIGK